MTPERLQPTEDTPAAAPIHSSAMTTFSENAMKEVLHARKLSLEDLKSAISRKLYYILEEKIKHEEEEFQNLLDAQLGRKKTLSKYTFVLDPQYFEQIFLN